MASKRGGRDGRDGREGRAPSAFAQGRAAAQRGESFRSGAPGSRGGASRGGATRGGARRDIEPVMTRPALAPALVAAIALFAGVALIGNAWFVVVLYVVAIFAAIMAVYAVQAGKAAWLALLVPVIVLWNPIFPLPYADWLADSDGLAWFVAQPVCAVLLVLAGILIRAPRQPDA